MRDTAPQDVAGGTAEPGSSTSRWALLATIMIGSIPSVMSSTIVNVAVPDLMRQFGIG